MKLGINISLSIILASFIIGSFLLAIQINKQNSIERQQMMKIEEAKEIRREDMDEYCENRGKTAEQIRMQEFLRKFKIYGK